MDRSKDNMKSWRGSFATLFARAKLFVIIYSKRRISCTPSQILAALLPFLLLLFIVYHINIAPDATTHNRDLFNQIEVTQTTHEPTKPAPTTHAPTTHDPDLFNQVELPPIVWKWGLCQLSDVHDSIRLMVLYAKTHGNDTPKQIIDLTLFEDIKDGDLICLPDSQINDFIERILPHITSYFSVLSHSGTSRAFISRLHNQSYIYEKLIRSKYLLKWFTANYDGNVNKKKYDYYGKLENIPLGWDFQTPWMMSSMKDKKVFGPKYLGHFNDPYPNYIGISSLLKNRSLIEQNLDHRIRDKVFVGRNLNTGIAYAKRNKYNLSYTEFLQYFEDNKEAFDAQKPWFTFVDRFKRKYPYRAGLHSILNKSQHDVWYMEELRYKQYEMFERRSKYVFVLSPFGNGWDCFRTWESILFGHIVIVQSTAGKGVDDMFINHELPVVIVDNIDAFADIDEDQLNEWYQKYKHLTYFENANTRYRMTNAYWINHMKNKATSLIP